MVRGGLEVLLGGFLVSVVNCVQPVSNDDSQGYKPSDDDSALYDDDSGDDDTILVDDDDYTPGDDDTVGDDDVGDDDTTGNLPPIAEAGGPYFGNIGEIMYFNFGQDGTGSYDPDGKIVDHSVDWGNGVVVTGVISPLIAIYPLPGDYDIVLTVRDNLGASSMDTAKAYIE